MAAVRALALTIAAVYGWGQTVAVRLAGGETARVEMEEYVGWVLAGEAGGMSSGEALKAMAVAARSYARQNRGRHGREGYDFCETTHCQDARRGAVTAKLRQAVEATEGAVLWYGGRPALVFYSGDCGGKSAAAGEIWRDAARPYLTGVEDSFCLSGGRSRWSAKVGWDELSAALGLPGLRQLQVARRTASGRVAVLQSNRGAVDAERLHLAVGRAKGWTFLRSRQYEVRAAGDAAWFEGYGRGHGAGLCQAGAEQRGLAGHTWRQILAAYFPGTKAGVAAQDIGWRVMQGERVEVWGTGAAGDESLAQLADRALAEAERRSGMSAGKRPQVRAYPAVAVFRDATGEAGRVAAVTRGRVIHMQPVATLRAAGTLQTTLLHEMVHVVFGLQTARPLPVWFEEGLADHLGNGRTHPAERLRVEALIQRRGLAAVLEMVRNGVVE